MGGPWRDRTYTVPKMPDAWFPNAAPRPTDPTPAPLDRLQVYAACLVIGMVLGAVALILVSPWLPFAVLR